MNMRRIREDLEDAKLCLQNLQGSLIILRKIVELQFSKPEDLEHYVDDLVSLSNEFKNVHLRAVKRGLIYLD